MYSPVPAVTGVSLDAGPAAGGTTVTITGNGFTGATEVDFGAANPAPSFEVVSDGEITATSAAGVGTVDITVTTPGGTSAVGAADEFTYTPVPVVTGVSPDTGPTVGGTTVTITGERLHGCDRGRFWSG